MKNVRKRSNVERSELKKILSVVIQNASHLLNLVDSREESETYGCCHRPFWSRQEDETLPIIPDFVNARWQEAGLTLAMLWSKPYPNNPYFGDDNIKKIIKAIMLYWTRIQHRDGSFDEWRKFEHGQPPTAFSTYAMIKALDIMKNEVSEEERNRIIKSIKKASDWLCFNSEPVGINHEVVAINTLYHAYLSFKNKKYLKAIDKKFKVIKERFSEEGWFNECGGPDTGYNEVSLTYLGLYWEASKDKRALSIANKVLNFNKYFFYPDYISGGGFNTRYATGTMPLGYAIFSEIFPLARELLSFSIKSIIKRKVNLFTTDYEKCVGLYHLLMLYDKCYDISLKNRYEKLPAFQTVNFFTYFKEARIAIIKKPFYYATIGKGGCIGSLFSYKSNLTLIYSSPVNLENVSGILMRKDGILLTNMNRNNIDTFHCANDFVEVKSGILPFNLEEDSIWHVKNPRDKKIIISHLIRECTPLAIGSWVINSLAFMYHLFKRKSKKILCNFERALIFYDYRIHIMNKVNMEMNHVHFAEPIAIHQNHLKAGAIRFDDSELLKLTDLEHCVERKCEKISLELGAKTLLSINLSSTCRCTFVLKDAKNNAKANIGSLNILITAQDKKLEYNIFFG